MAEDSMDDYNPMQLRLGLSPTGGSFNPVGVPTQPFMPPGVMHPGQAAMNIVNQTQTAAAHTMQSAQAIQASMPPAYNTFAQQYQANMAGIQSNYQNPFYAQALGGGGFNPGMMPMPSQMTSPGMGIFRPFPQGMASSIPPVPQLPFFRGPFTPTIPGPRFSSPYEYAYGMQQQRMDQYAAGGLALPGAAAHFGATALGGYVGRGLGALAGAAIGGVPGAMFGATAGGIAGMFGSEMSGFSSGVHGLVDHMNPFRMPFMRGAQIQGASTNFVTSGADLNTVGLGLSRGSSLRLGNMLSTMGGNRDFQNATGNQFSSSDLFRITQGAGQNGLLDASQSPEQIRDSVKNIAKSLRLFMQIAHEPDVKEALRMMGQARNMGLSLGEHMGMMTEARMFSRMAGTSIGGLAETGGLPGAMTFQQGGLTAGLGMRMGQGMLGLARQSVAGGAYSAQAYGLLGGTQGIAQRDTESALALLKMPMLTAAMSQYSGGQFGLHSGNVSGLASGQFSIGQMANMGVNNMQAAVARGGVGALGTFMMQQPELQDSLGRQLGPMGMKAVQMNTVLDFMKTLGVKGADGFNMAAMSFTGGDASAARQLRDQASSPAFFTGMRRQLEIGRNESRVSDEDYRDRTRLGVVRRGLRDNGLSGAGSNLSGFINNAIETSGRAFEQMGDWGSGDTINTYTDHHLLANSDAEAAALGGKVSSDFMAKLATKASHSYDQSYGVQRALGHGTVLSRIFAIQGRHDDNEMAQGLVRGGQRLQVGLTANADKRVAARKSLGPDGGRLVSAFAVELAEAARKRFDTLGGNGRLSDGDLKGVLATMKSKGTIDGDQYNELIKDGKLDALVTASAEEAARYAGPEGRLTMVSVAPELAGLGTRAENESNAKLGLRNIGREMIGEDTIKSGFSESLSAVINRGRDENISNVQRELRTLGAADPSGKASTLAAYMAAADQHVEGAAEKASALQQQLEDSGPRGRKLIDAAKATASRLGSNSQMKAIGNTLVHSANAVATVAYWNKEGNDWMNLVPRGAAMAQLHSTNPEDPAVKALAATMAEKNSFNINGANDEGTTNQTAADMSKLQDTMAKTFPDAVLNLLRAAERQNRALDRQGIE